MTLATDIPRPVDLIFLAGAKHLYLPVLEILEPHLTARSLVVADNAGRSDGYLRYVRTSGKYVSTPAADDIEISVKIHPLTPPPGDAPAPGFLAADHPPLHRTPWAAPELGGPRNNGFVSSDRCSALTRGAAPRHTAITLVFVA